MSLEMRRLLICLLFVCQAVGSVELERLYETEVVVKSEQQQNRVVAIKKALKTVLTRVLAGDKVFQDPGVRKLLDNASQYTLEYQYSLVSNNIEHNDETRLMRVLFDEQALVKVLLTAQVGLWNEIRPSTLLWLVVEDEGKQKMFDAELMPEIDYALTKATREKGLPILYPIQDLKEKQLLSVSDVLSAYSERLLSVSWSYDVVSIVAAKIVNKGSCWKAEWTLYFDSKIRQWQGQCGSSQEVILNGFQGIYDHLARYYAIKPNLIELAPLILKISNVKNMNELERVTEYLDSLPMIMIATKLRTEAEYNIYRIFYQGDRQDLHNTLENDHILALETVSKIDDEQLKYKFLSK